MHQMGGECQNAKRDVIEPSLNQSSEHEVNCSVKRKWHVFDECDVNQLVNKRWCLAGVKKSLQHYNMKQQAVLLLHWVGMLLYYRVIPALNVPVPNYTHWRRRGTVRF